MIYVLVYANMLWVWLRWSAAELVYVRGSCHSNQAIAGFRGTARPVCIRRGQSGRPVQQLQGRGGGDWELRAPKKALFWMAKELLAGWKGPFGSGGYPNWPKREPLGATRVLYGHGRKEQWHQQFAQIQLKRQGSNQGPIGRSACGSYQKALTRCQAQRHCSSFGPWGSKSHIMFTALGM